MTTQDEWDDMSEDGQGGWITCEGCDDFDCKIPDHTAWD